MIPSYILYGDTKKDAFPDILHVEPIADRSGKHNWKIAPHRHHNLHQFFYIKTAGGLLYTDTEERELSADQILSIPPLIVHGFNFPKDTEGLVITVPWRFLAEALQHSPEIKSTLQGQMHVLDRISNPVYFEQIHSDHQNRFPGRNQCLINLASQLAIDIGRQIQTSEQTLPVKEGKAARLVEHFLKNLERDFRSHHSVTYYAQQLNITAPHLSRICRQLTNRPASELVQDRLIAEAKRSLIYSRLPVSDLAYALGFEDPAHFSKYFLRHAGKAPSKFRRDADQQHF